jgi:uncharacterized damage-inducible protein DinB
MDRSIIDQYEKGGEKLRRAIAGLSDADLKAFPVPGTWSIQQVVIHLQDSDIIWASRMKCIIAEENPTIVGFDESRFASNLFYADQRVEDAVQLFDLNRKQLSRVLRKLPDAAFARAGRHNERGAITLEQALTDMVAHLDHHLKFLYSKREKLGKPLKD